MSTIPDQGPEQEEEMLTPEELQYAPLEAKLREWQFPYTAEREFPVSEVRFVDASQVRSLANIAPRLRVEEYAMQMRNGAIFPPILLRRPGNVLIDGNTRLKAAQMVGRKTFPAIIVDTKTEDLAKILAASVNQMGGERLTPSEAHETALLMLKTGYPEATIARELGRDLAQVRRWRNQQDVVDRAGKLGFTEEQLKPLARTTLGTLAQVRLDEPFKEILRLFTEVRPGEKQGREMVDKVNQAASESAALRVIDDLREELAPAGPPPRAATREIPLARAAIANLVKFQGRPSAAFDPRKADEEFARWERIAQVANEVMTAIRAVQQERSHV